MHPDMLKIISDNEQDLEAAKEWWNGTDILEKKVVWERIMVTHTIAESLNDVSMMIICRMAQLCFAQLFEEYIRNKEDK